MPFDGARNLANMWLLMFFMWIVLVFTYNVFLATIIILPPAWIALRLCNAFERKDLEDIASGRWP